MRKLLPSRAVRGDTSLKWSLRLGTFNLGWEVRKWWGDNKCKYEVLSILLHAVCCTLALLFHKQRVRK